MGRLVPLPVAPNARVPVRVQNQVTGGQPQVPFGTAQPAGAGAGQRVTQPRIVLQAGPPLSQEKTQSRQINDLQQKSFRSTQQAKANPMANGNMIERVGFAGGTPLALNHGLSGAWRGVLLMNFSNGTTWGVVPAGTNPQQDLTQVVITCTTSCLCDVWVYG